MTEAKYEHLTDHPMYAALRDMLEPWVLRAVSAEATIARLTAQAEALADALKQVLVGVSENHRGDCACCDCAARAALADYREAK